MQIAQKNDSCCKTAEQNKLIISYDDWCMRRFRERAELLCDQQKKMTDATKFDQNTAD